MQTKSTNLSEAASPELAERIQRVENGFPSLSQSGNEPPLELTLQKLMQLYKVPGLSIAVIDNFEIAWAKGYGITEAVSSNPVTTHTLFQAGSVSKAVAAAGALHLVEQGKLSLDENINHSLKTWKVPGNEFTQEQKVTLRRILSHSAGLTVHFFPGYSIKDPIPTLTQILDGNPPANTASIRVDIVPGTKWRYSGGGLLVAQQAMIDVTNLPFPQLMREAIFDNMEMYDSSFEHPLPAERVKQAASGTHWNGNTVEGKWHLYPEMAAGGLWTTPSDLAKLAIELALAKRGKSNRILSHTMAREMLTPQREDVTEFALGNAEHPDRMGLGFFLGDEARPNLFGHIGDDAGFQAMLMMDSEAGQGAAIMANSELGILLGDCLLENIAQEYGWENFIAPNRPRACAGAALLVAYEEKGIQAVLTQYQMLRNAKLPRYAPDENTLLVLGYLLLADKKPEDALEALKLEVLEYPQYWNAYDTLAEVYMTIGEKQLAIQNYQKSIEINPENQNAVENIKGLIEQS
ncbi:MAG TPA: serine hydrolase [Anaerolineales bacterium]|nr:serine hydrolase [Anaerolineales bacterium]